MYIAEMTTKHKDCPNPNEVWLAGTCVYIAPSGIMPNDYQKVQLDVCGKEAHSDIFVFDRASITSSCFAHIKHHKSMYYGRLNMAAINTTSLNSQQSNDVCCMLVELLEYLFRQINTSNIGHCKLCVSLLYKHCNKECV